MPVKNTVWLANYHGEILGDTNLFVEEMNNGEEGNGPESMVKIFVTAFIRNIGCNDTEITLEEAREMIKGSYSKDGKTFIKLPERFGCPKHGFANSSV